MMKNKKYIPLLAALLFSLVVHAQKPRLFIGATAHLGNGKFIQNSAISVSDGKFEMIADATLIRIDPSAFDTIIATPINEKITMARIYFVIVFNSDI